MSMLAEATGTGKPLHIFDMGDGEARWWWRLHNYRYKPLSHHLAMRLGPARMRRDIGRIQQTLVDTGQAVWLGQQHGGGVPGELVGAGDLEISVERVRNLLALDAGTSL